MSCSYNKLATREPAGGVTDSWETTCSALFSVVLFLGCVVFAGFVSSTGCLSLQLVLCGAKYRIMWNNIVKTIANMRAYLSRLLGVHVTSLTELPCSVSISFLVEQFVHLMQFRPDGE